MRLNDLKIRNLKYQGKPEKIFDDAFPQFGVRVYKSGKSFILMYGLKRKMKTIGRYPDISLKTARERARAFLVLNNTSDTKTASVSISEARKLYLSHCESKNRPRTVFDYTRLLNLHLPTGNLDNLTRRSLMDKLTELSHVPAEQSHAFTAISVFLNFCVQRGWLENNPLIGLKKLGTIKTRDRVLSPEEIAIVYKKATIYPFGHIVRMCILTGMRRGEVANLKREYIKPDVIVLSREATKNNREHVFPYSDLTTDLLEDCPTGGEYIFNAGMAKPFNGWGKCKKRFDMTLELEPYTLHDLRRSFASIHASELKTPIHIIEKLLNHQGQLSGIAGIYNRYSYLDEMREACIKYENWLRSLTQ